MNNYISFWYKDIAKAREEVEAVQDLIYITTMNIPVKKHILNKLSLVIKHLKKGRSYEKGQVRQNTPRPKETCVA